MAKRKTALGPEHPSSLSIVDSLRLALSREAQLAFDLLPAEVASAEEHGWSHTHPLALCRKAPYPGGSYGCDICDRGGVGSVYRCAECGFDAHPQCVCDKQLFAAK